MASAMDPRRATSAPTGGGRSEKITRYTVRPCPRTSDERPRLVIVIPPTTDLGAGFSIAREELDRGLPVRLAGIGVTSKRAWPSWVLDAPGLWLTELTAYRRVSRWEAAEPLRDGLKALTDEVFDGAFPGLRGSEVFYPHVGLRAFAVVNFLMPVAMGLAEHHAEDTLRSTEPGWAGLAVWRALLGGRPERGGGLRWAARIAGLAAAGWAVSLTRVTRTYLESRTGLRELRRRPHLGDPRHFIQVSPDIPRQNDALLDATRGQAAGVLLHGHLGPGERDELQLGTRRGRELWPALRRLDPATVPAWDTTSTPPSAVDFGRACAVFTRSCAVATFRLCRRGPLLALGPGSVDLSAQAVALVRMVTLDLARTCMADVATRRAVARNRYAGTTILSMGAHAADVAVALRHLQHAGAVTVDFTHGWAGEPEAFSEEPPCDYRCVWSHTDARPGAAVRFLVGGMQTAAPLQHAPRGDRARVLLLSNYMHRDDAVYRIGLDPYVHELLDIARRDDPRCVYRWRPHPADRRDAVTRASEGLSAEISRGRSLEEDLAWADVVVSTLSTALPKALLAGLPVLVHITPDADDTARVLPFSPQRRFFSAADGAAKLDAIVAQLDAPETLEPERGTLAFLFGDSRTPRTLAEALEPLLRGRDPTEAARTGTATGPANRPRA
jgi:hypothetical protein